MSKTQEQIHYNMQQVKNKDSKIELLLRKALRQKGLRYRKNVKSVFGHPDIAFIGKKVAVFCDSEFWHGYDWEHRKEDFKVRQDFWIPKIERNRKRDREVNEKLINDGWVVLRFWGKEIKNNLENCVSQIIKMLNDRKTEEIADACKPNIGTIL